MFEPNDKYTKVPYPKIRRATIGVLKAAKRKNMIHSMIEVDISSARKNLRKIKKETNNYVSFTGYIIYCVSKAGFSHLQIIWWAHLTDGLQKRKTLIAEKLFKKAPDKIGIFGTRAPARPNPIMISTIQVEKIDIEKGIIHTPFIDAEPGSPILDIKPYFPMERVKKCDVPEWFKHWPEWSEDAMSFNWQKEINFD